LFQQRTGSEEALTYNDNSVLENMHVSRAFKLMRKHIKYNILADLKKEDQGLVRKLVISLVLQTDMAKHADGIRGLQRKTQYKLEAKAKWMDNSNPENSKVAMLYLYVASLNFSYLKRISWMMLNFY